MGKNVVIKTHATTHAVAAEPETVCLEITERLDRRKPSAADAVIDM
jgi:hypothetical protein